MGLISGQQYKRLVILALLFLLSLFYVAYATESVAELKSQISNSQSEIEKIQEEIRKYEQELKAVT